VFPLYNIKNISVIYGITTAAIDELTISKRNLITNFEKKVVSLLLSSNNSEIQTKVVLESSKIHGFLEHPHSFK
jgi:hypothetical protein